jgi:hypothetical protein
MLDGGDPEAAPEVGGGQMMRENRQTGEAVPYDPENDNKPEDNFFEFDDEEIDENDEDKVKQFMAVKPWIGAIKEPENHPPVDKSAPDTGYEIEYVYGYRC